MAGLSTTRVLLAIMLLAFGVRAGAALVHPVVDPKRYPDAGDYHDLGMAISAGEAYRVPGGFAVRMPGYPLVIAGIYKVAGAQPLAVLMVQAAAGAGACWLFWRNLRPMSERTALVAAGLWAVDPLSVATSASLFSESLFAVCLVGVIALAAEVWKRPERVALWTGLGMVSAAAVYLRAASLYLPAVFVAAVLAARFSWRASVGGGVAIIIVLAALLPWKLFLARHAETAALRGLTSLEGISLYEAVYADATGGPKQGDILAAQSPEIRAMPEGIRDGYYRDQAWREIRANPGRVAALAPLKVARTWSPGLNAEELRSPLINVVLWGWYVPLFALAAVGVLSRQLGGRLRMVLVIPILYFTALHALFLGSVRYRVPLHAVLCMLAAVGVTEILRRWRRGTDGAADTPNDASAGG